MSLKGINPKKLDLLTRKIQHYHILNGDGYLGQEKLKPLIVEDVSSLSEKELDYFIYSVEERTKNLSYNNMVLEEEKILNHIDNLKDLKQVIKSFFIGLIGCVLIGLLI